VVIGGPAGLLLMLFVAYLGLPLATVYGLWRRDPAKYIEEEAGRIEGRIQRFLGLLGSVSLVLGNVAFKDARSAVRIDRSASTPNLRSALSRLYYGVPMIATLVVCIAAGSILWVVAVIGLLAWGNYPQIIYRTLLRSLCFAGEFACYQASLVDIHPRFWARSKMCVWEDPSATFLPGGEARGFVKDWVTTLISTSGVLVTLVLAALALLHNDQHHYSYWYLAVDIPAVLGMVYFLAGILYGFQSLGNLVSGATRVRRSARFRYDAGAGVEPGDKGSKHLEMSRILAFASLRMFLRGLALVVITALGVVLVYATNKGG
jgi:hypothetical protein